STDSISGLSLPPKSTSARACAVDTPGPRDVLAWLQCLDDRAFFADDAQAMSDAYPPQLPRIHRAVEDVRALDARTPRVALGSGLGRFADTLAERTVIPYDRIRGMPASKIVGHAGNLVIGQVGAMPVVAMQGRVHLYEGHSTADVVFGVRLMRHLGATILII